jgi:hypothetical protein
LIGEGAVAEISGDVAGVVNRDGPGSLYGHLELTIARRSAACRRLLFRHSPSNSPPPDTASAFLPRRRP